MRELRMTKSLSHNKCIVDRSDIVEIIDLGMHPYADTFIPYERIYDSEPVFPLKCGLCSECGLVQLIHLTNPGSRYGMYDYSYTSSNSEYARAHWRSFAETAISSQEPAVRVLEIGSNDGFLLGQFVSKGCKVLGFDSSEAMTKIANDQGIPTINGIFNLNEAEKLAAADFRFELIIANNVLNHSNDPIDFLKGVEMLLTREGRFIFEVPYWLCSIESGNFDQIYHEHISYFTITSLSRMIEHTELKIFDIELNEYHGGSLKVTLTNSDVLEPPKWSHLIETEELAKLNDIETYSEFMEEVKNKRGKLLLKIYQILLTEPNASIVLAGAAAKANTFINFHRLDSTIVTCITDNSPHKVGKYTPLSRIPIVKDQEIATMKNVYVLTTAWNIRDIIMDQILKINPDAKVLNYE
jgi:2-polyprenyl-3-methyl-5-hydroxy-6-metoxy-1,4-benzoquinol methylase